MAITIASANAALLRNNMGHIELIKHSCGQMHVVTTCEAEAIYLGFHDDEGQPVTRVRDLTVTEVVAMGSRLCEVIAERLRADLIAATGREQLAETVAALQDKGVEIVADVETLTNGFADEGNIADSGKLSERAQQIVDRRFDNVAHVDNRSKAGMFPQMVGRAERATPKPDAQVTQENRDKLQQFAKEQNEAFVASLGPAKPGLAFHILRSGDLRIGDAHTTDGRQCHTWKMRQLGMRFMSERSADWWHRNAERLSLGYLPEDAGTKLTPERIRQHAATLDGMRHVANKAGKFAYLIVDDYGSSTAKMGIDLRDAFARINRGERVFIHSQDLKRYDRELKEGKHGQPRGSADL